METVYRDYAPKGVKFYYIYKALAHPETNGYVKPITLQERLLHIREAKQKLGSKIPWLCDSMENTALHSLGNAPNSEFVIDPEGKIVVRRVWSRPQQLRSDLEKFVGPVEKPTRVEDLDIRPYSRRVETGVADIEPLKLPSNLRPLKQTVGLSAEPWYVKLRAEAEPSVTSKRQGKIYLGFRLDPLYKVHWNNLAGPFEFEIRNAQGVKIEPTRGVGPKLEVETDAAPREFLVEATPAGDDQPPSFDVVVRYFACHDTEGWCKPFSHTYHVIVQPDSDGGRAVRRGSARRPPADRQRARGPGGPNRPGGPMAARGDRVMGVVTAVDGDRQVMTLRLRDGSSQTFRWTDNTMVMKRGNGRPERGSIQDVRRGARVMLQPKRPSDAKGPPTIERMMVMPGPPARR